MDVTSVVYQSGNAEWLKKAGSAQSEASKPGARPDANKSEAKDSVSLSGNAKDAKAQGSATAAALKSRAAALPELREEKISVAQSRVESGYYNRPEFSEELAAHMLGA
jgi:ABC-type uncharacterized transport system auxiliary subunit